MKTVVLESAKLHQREQAHDYLAQMLALPAYYGRNLDALYDCLTEMGEWTVVLEGREALAMADGYGGKVLAVLWEAALANPGLHLDIR